MKISSPYFCEKGQSGIFFGARGPKLTLTPPPSEKTSVTPKAMPKTRKGRMLAVTLASLMSGTAGYIINDSYSKYPTYQAPAAVSDTRIHNTRTEKVYNVNPQSLDERLIIAALHDNPKEVERLLRQGANVNATDGNGMTALHVATENTQTPDVVAVLLKHKADPNIQDDFGRSPLHLAAHYGRNVDLLLRHGASVNLRDENGDTPLHHGITPRSPELLTLLLTRPSPISVPINAQNARGETALHHAAGAHHAYNMEILIVQGAHVNARDDNDNTPLHRAAMTNYVDSARVLLESGADINAKNRDGFTAMEIAMRHGNGNMADYLKNYSSKASQAKTSGSKTKTPQFGAKLKLTPPPAEKQQQTKPSAPVHKKGITLLALALSGLIGGVANTTAKNIHSTPPPISNPFMISSANLSFPESPHIAPVTNIAAELPEGEALIRAALLDDVQQAQRLIKNGINLNAVDGSGRTALHVALENTRTFAVPGALVQSGANVNRHDHQGRTPMHIVADQGNDDAANMLFRYGAALNARDKNGSTPVHIAAAQGHMQVLYDLVERGGNVNATNTQGQTPLHLASGIVVAYHVDFLLDHGANINARDEDGNTALHYAAMAPFAKQINNAKSLLDRGVDLKAVNKHGQSALDIAMTHHNHGMIEFLRNYKKAVS